MLADAANTERAHAPGIAHGVELALSQDDQAIRAAYLWESGSHTFAKGCALRLQHQAGHGLAVAQFFTIHQVAIVRDSDGSYLAALVPDHKRASVLHTA